jgi:hypothetical protein
MMKNIILILSFLIICSSSYCQKVTLDIDESVDFSNFKSYQFLGWQNDSDKIINDLDKKRLRNSFESELTARQLEQVESGADIAISLYLVVTQESSTTAYTNYYGGTGYRYGRRGRGWGNGYSTTTYSESDYLKGTLVMDVFDGESQELVWQGVATGTIKDKPEKREKSIPKTVGKLMKKFPIAKTK